MAVADLVDGCLCQGCKILVSDSRRRFGDDDRRMVSVHGEVKPAGLTGDIEYKKGIRWMPWHQEAMKDVARCEKPRGAASRR